MFWWIFALRGGFALVFALVLRFAASLLGTIFFDPVMLVCISLLLGSYVFANGVLLGVAGVYARQHHLRLWSVLLAEALFALVLAGFIGFSLRMTSESLASLAALHTLGVGCFQAASAIRLHGNTRSQWILSLLALASWLMGVIFLLNRYEEVRTLTVWLSGFELIFGVVVLVFAFWLHREAPAKSGPTLIAPAPAGA
jgi:uncharacterized membrane protein HdeD (DUF308 family)